MTTYLSIPTLSKNIDADLGITLIEKNVESAAGDKVSCVYEFEGVSQRTALGDDLEIGLKQKQNDNTLIKFCLKRDSLYHILPEYLFHPLDIYLGLEGDSDEFNRRYKEQNDQRNTALQYFNLFDSQFQTLRNKYQNWLNENIFQDNRFLSDFMTEGYNVNMQNPYIHSVYQCIPWIRDYRGCDKMIHTVLNYAFKGNCDIECCESETDESITDSVHTTVDRSFDSLFSGDTYVVKSKKWKVFYHTDVKTELELESLESNIKEFTLFFRDWFLSVDSELEINFGNTEASPIISKENVGEGIFLNYSTQLI